MSLTIRNEQAPPEAGVSAPVANGPPMQAGAEREPGRMSISRRALFGFIAGLPLALKALAVEKPMTATEAVMLDRMDRERLLHNQWGGVLDCNPDSDSHWLQPRRACRFPNGRENRF